MMRGMLLALLLCGGGPAVAQGTQAPAAPAPAAPATMPQAPIDPARQAAADRVVAALVPRGIYARMMRDRFPAIMNTMMARTMGMTGADLGIPGSAGDTRTLAEAAGEGDPHFRERMEITTRVMAEEFGTLFDAMEPRVRAGLGRAYARQFTTAQLNDMNAFFATPSGQAYADSYLLTFMDPELITEMMGIAPEMMKAMPAMMARVEKETAHLPPPKRASDDAAGPDAVEGEAE